MLNIHNKLALKKSYDQTSYVKDNGLYIVLIRNKTINKFPSHNVLFTLPKKPTSSQLNSRKFFK